MIKLIVVVAIFFTIHAVWLGWLQVLSWGSVATVISPAEIVKTAETYLDDIASTTAERTADVLDGVALELDRNAPSAYDEFPVRYSMTIGTVTVEASVATSVADRVKGLSGTTLLPANVVKLFVFDTDGPQSMWMKDMNYPIDIMWLDANGVVVHIAPAVDPSTYPASFSSPIPARYVIEANAGFAAREAVTIGAQVILPPLR